MRRSSDEKNACWQQILGEWAASEMSIVGFCKSRKIPVSGFYYWRKRLGTAGPRQQPNHDGGATDADGMFWRVEDNDGAAGVTVIAGAYRLELSENFSEVTLRRALAVLAGLRGK